MEQGKSGINRQGLTFMGIWLHHISFHSQLVPRQKWLSSHHRSETVHNISSLRLTGPQVAFSCRFQQTIPHLNLKVRQFECLLKDMAEVSNTWHLPPAADICAWDRLNIGPTVKGPVSNEYHSHYLQVHQYKPGLTTNRTKRAVLCVFQTLTKLTVIQILARHEG